MANQANSLAHTKWLCKYHIVFTPKYRRKIIYNQYKQDLAEILHQLCAYNVNFQSFYNSNSPNSTCLSMERSADLLKR